MNAWIKKVERQQTIINNLVAAFEIVSNRLCDGCINELTFNFTAACRDNCEDYQKVTQALAKAKEGFK